MKTALLMEGGAMRGMFTCGVIDVLMENGISFDAAAGISAGAVFGCNYKSRQIGRPFRYNLKYARDKRYCSLRSLLRTGDLYGADFCYRLLPDILDPFDRKTFALNPMAFFVGATDAETGEILYHRCADGGEMDMAWLRASASMPFVSRPVPAEGRLLLDGGIVEPVPCAFMESEGYDRRVLVLTQPKGYRKKRALPLPLLRLALPGYPKIARALSLRPERYNRQMEEIDRAEAARSVLVLRPPSPLNIGHTEHRPRELERVYRIGRVEAEARLDEIRSFLSVSPSQNAPQSRKGAAP